MHNFSLKRYSVLSLLELTLVASLSSLSFAEGVFPAVERVIAVGDIHGDYDNFRQVLRDAEVINRRGNWIAGESHFVQLGDLPDRGPDTDKIIEHMQKLQEQAAEDGGKVHALIGNHEAMNIYGDLRYVHPGEYSALRSSRSRGFRDQYYDNEVARLSALDENFVADKEFRDQWMQKYPLGYVEHRIAWNPQGEIGSWVTENNAIVKIGRVLFLHAGISQSVLDLTIDEINVQVQRELKGDLPEEPGLSEADDGPLWYRGLASAEEELELEHVNAVLAAFDVDRVVLGHTPSLGTIVPRFGGKVIIADAGISSHYGGHLASLLIVGDDFFTQQEGEQIPLPNSDEEMLSYFENIISVKGSTPSLERHLENLRASYLPQ